MIRTELQNMKSVELRKIASKVGVKNYTKFTKDELVEQILTTQIPDMVGYLNQEEIPEDVSKSEKIRILLKKGYKRTEVAKLLNVRYQMVRGVELRMK